MKKKKKTNKSSVVLFCLNKSKYEMENKTCASAMYLKIKVMFVIVGSFIIQENIVLLIMLQREFYKL